MPASREEQLIAAIRHRYEAYNRGDFDEVVGGFNPDVELVPSGGQTAIKGIDRFRAWLEPDAFERQIVEMVDVRVAGDKALVRLRSRARGATSGIELDFHSWLVYTFDDGGLATRMEIFFDHEEAKAVRAAGLHDQSTETT